MKRCRMVVIALSSLGLVLPIAATAVAQEVAAVPPPASVFESIPADAWGAVVIRDLSGLNKKIIAIGQELGLPIGPGTMVGDPLAMLKGMLGISEGLNDKGSIALVMQKMEEVNADALSKSMVLLVPCTDSKAFLEQFATGAGEEGEAKSEGDKPGEGGDAKAALPKGVMKVSLMGKPSYAMAKGSYAVLAPEPEALKAFANTKGSMRPSLAADRLAMVDKKFDAFMWLNIEAAGPALKDTVKSALMGMMLMGAMGDPTVADQVQPFIENVEKFFDQTKSVQIGLAAAKTGFDIDLYMQAKPDTELAKSIAQRKTSEKSLLLGLPAEKYVLALAATSTTSKDDIKQATVTLGSLLDRPQVQKVCDKEKLAEFKKILTQFMDLSVGAEWMSMSVSRLEGDDGMIGLTIVNQIPHGAKKWKDAVGKLIEQGLGMVTDEEVRKILDAVQYKAEAEKVGEAQVGHLSLDMTKLPDLDEDDVAAVKKIIGKEGGLVRIAALDDDHAAVLLGGGSKRVAQVAAMAKQDSAALAADPGMKAIEAALPKGKRFFEAYVAVDTLLNLINDAALAVGEEEKPIAAEIPQINAPVAVLGLCGEQSQQIAIHVPMKVVKGIKDVAMGAAAEKVQLPMEEKEESGAKAEEKPAAPAEGGVK